MEKRYFRKDGSIVWVNLHVSPGWSPGGTPSYHVAVVEDITERKHLEERLNRMQRLESLGTLAGGIAHGFNNLHTALFGWLELIRFRTTEQPVIECVDKAMKAMERARELTGQLLTFAEGGAPAMVPLDIRSLLNEVSASQSDGSNVLVHSAPTLPRVNADPAQLRLVLENLLTNAKQSMRSGGRIDMKAETLRSGWVRITVSDQGQGIPPENLSRIFDPFFSTRPGGRGLGLATAHSIVVRHGGELHVETGASGTSFMIDLPAHGVPQAAQ